MPAPSSPLLDEKALDALRRTRPWLYLLGILSCLTAGLGLILLVAGSIALSVASGRASLLMGGGFALVLIALPTAVVQLGYALALSRVGEATGEALGAAVELACIRQRNLWIVNAFTVGLLLVWTLIHLVFRVGLFI